MLSPAFQLSAASARTSRHNNSLTHGATSQGSRQPLARYRNYRFRSSAMDRSFAPAPKLYRPPQSLSAIPASFHRRTGRAKKRSETNMTILWAREIPFKVLGSLYAHRGTKRQNFQGLLQLYPHGFTVSDQKLAFCMHIDFPSCLRHCLFTLIDLYNLLI